MRGISWNKVTFHENNFKVVDLCCIRESVNDESVTKAGLVLRLSGVFKRGVMTK